MCFEVWRHGRRVFERTRGQDFETFDASCLCRHTPLSHFHRHDSPLGPSLDLPVLAPFCASVDVAPPPSHTKTSESGEVGGPLSPTARIWTNPFRKRNQPNQRLISYLRRLQLVAVKGLRLTLRRGTARQWNFYCRSREFSANGPLLCGRFYFEQL